MLASKLGFAAALVAALAACSSTVVVPATDDPSGGAGGTTNATIASSSTVGVGGSGAGIGEPSDVYPAPHPDPPTVVDLGGPVMDAPVIIPVYFASDDANLLSGVTTFIDQIGPSSFWTATTAEYGVGAATSMPPIVLTESAPTTIDDTEISAWLAAKLNADDPAFPSANTNTLFAIYYPAGTTITLNDSGGGSSCSSFGGYHSNTKLDSAHANARVPYAVLPRCGDWGSFTGADALTIPSSHEFVEAATDPLPLQFPAYGQPDDDHVYWAFLLGGETGDLCAQSPSSYSFFHPDLDYAAQRCWSNASALAGHDPCVPADPGKVYFAAAPVLEDAVSLGMGFQTKGVQIATGESQTIDVKLFSDGPTPPFKVVAHDLTPQLGAGGSLSLFLDEIEGQNGQTLHLNITVNSPSQYQVEFFALRAELNGEEHSWLGLVAN